MDKIVSNSNSIFAREVPGFRSVGYVYIGVATYSIPISIRLANFSNQVESNIILLHNSTALPRSKHCSTKLPLRAGLI